MLFRKSRVTRFVGMMAAGLIVAVIALFVFAPTAGASGYGCGNWNASYWNNPDLHGHPDLTRCEEAIDFDWHGLSPDGAINVDNFSALWIRTYPFDAGTYRFQATMDDGMRVFVDGKVIIDSFHEGDIRTIEKDVNLPAGPHEIAVEYFEKGGNAVAGFTWTRVDGQAMPPKHPKPMPPMYPEQPMPPMYPEQPAQPMPPMGKPMPMPPTGNVDYPVAEVKASYLNVRSGPGVDYPVVGVLHQNAVVYLVGRDMSAKWVLIKTQGLGGWVNRYYLHTDFPYTSLPFVDGGGQPGPMPPQPPMPQYDAVVTASSLNVRSGPGVQYRAVAVVHGGTEVMVLAKEANGWVKIQIPGSVVGFVNGAYLSYR